MCSHAVKREPAITSQLINDLDDFFLRAGQSDVAPVKAFTLSGAAPHGIRIAGALLLMHCNHAGPHKEDAHVSVCACVCNSTTFVMSGGSHHLKPDYACNSSKQMQS